MARLCAVFVSFLLALGAGNAFAQAAYLHNLNGTATASTGGAERALRIGDILHSGTTVSTGDKSYAVIKFEDGQVMALGERSSFRIVEYRYNKQRVADSSAVFDLVRGGLRFITGVIGSTNRNSFRMTAGTATIGIRGTSAIVQFDEVAKAVIAAVYVGSLQMVTKDGTVAINSGDIATYTVGTRPEVRWIEQAEATTKARLNVYLAIPAPNNMPTALNAAAAAVTAVAHARRLAALAASDPTLKPAADEARKLAEAAVLKAIQAAQDAYDEAIAGGAVRPDPAVRVPRDARKGPRPSTDGDGLEGDDETQEQIEQLITPGATPCPASCS